MLFTQASDWPHLSTALAPHGRPALPPHVLSPLPQPPYPYLSALGFGPSSSRFSHKISREHADFSRHTQSPKGTHEVGNRRMMRAANPLASSSKRPTTFCFTIPAHDTVHSPPSFAILPPLEMGLTFHPLPPAPRPGKRSRAAGDIDGEHSSLQKKKRRLRLFLITSRLSPEFSYPATNIVDRGSSKIAVWAKQRALGRNLLRKAAILNRIRQKAAPATDAEEEHGHALVEQDKEKEEMELARMEFSMGSVDTYTRPVRLPHVPTVPTARKHGHHSKSRSPTTSPSTSRSSSPTPRSPPLTAVVDDGDSTLTYRSPNEAYATSPPRAQLPRRDYLPLPPSPLGLSNYDAFDVEEDIPDPYSHFDDEDEAIPNPYADDAYDTGHDLFSSGSPGSLPTAHVWSASPSPAAEPQALYSDFDVLDPEEPVIGDYDQIEEGADPIWPGSYVKEESNLAQGSTSPDFAALFATAPVVPASKRADSFALSPNFRPTIPAKPASPNFTPVVTSSFTSISSTTLSSFSISPNLVASEPPSSDDFTPPSTSPNFTPAVAPTYYEAWPKVAPGKNKTTQQKQNHRNASN